MTMNYQKGQKNFSFNNLIVSLPGPIWDVFEYQNRVLITLDPHFGLQNVFCYSKEGNLLWTIQKTDFFKAGHMGFEGIALTTTQDINNPLRAFCRGRPFYLDIETGNVSPVPGVPDRM